MDKKNENTNKKKEFLSLLFKIYLEIERNYQSLRKSRFKVPLGLF